MTSIRPLWRDAELSAVISDQAEPICGQHSRKRIGWLDFTHLRHTWHSQWTSCSSSGRSSMNTGAFVGASGSCIHFKLRSGCQPCFTGITIFCGSLIEGPLLGYSAQLTMVDSPYQRCPSIMSFCLAFRLSLERSAIVFEHASFHHNLLSFWWNSCQAVKLIFEHQALALWYPHLRHGFPCPI